MRARKRWGIVATLGVSVGIFAACGIDAVGSALAPATPDAEAGLPPSLPETGVMDGGVDAPIVDDGGDSSVVVSACAACMAANGTCFTDAGTPTCVIACTGQGSCANVVCPPGIPCNITCKDDKSCDAVDCRAASACKIDCLGKSSCRSVQCAGTTCAVSCIGDDTCSNDAGSVIDCKATTSCALVCNGKRACDDLRCQSALCTVDCTGDPACSRVRTNGTTDAGCEDHTCNNFGCTGTACNLVCKGGSSCAGVCCDAGTCTNSAQAGPNCGP